MVVHALPLIWMQWQIANDILHKMDINIDPCTDFYQFACGNYIRTTKLPDDKTMMWVFVDMRDKMILQIRDLMESNETTDTESAKLAREYYKSCTDIPSMESAGLSPLHNTLKRYGGWPIVEGQMWNQNEHEWMSLSSKLALETGVSPIIQFSIEPDYGNSTRYLLDIDQPKLGLDKREYYLDPNNTRALDAYRKFLATTAIQLGANEIDANQSARDVVDFETALANISMSDEDRRDIHVLYNLMTVKELKEKYPKMDFDTWFSYASEKNWTFKDTEILNVAGVQFLNQLADVMANFSSRTIANYQLWILTQDLVKFLPPSLRDNYRQFQEALTGVKKFEPRYDLGDARSEKCMLGGENVCLTCCKPCNGRSPLYTSRDISTPKAKLRYTVMANFPNMQEFAFHIDSLMSLIRKAMKPTLDDADWMDESTKEYAGKKLANMIDNMAYPTDQINDENWLMRDYRQVSLNEDRYMDNFLAISASVEARKRREFYDAINRTLWHGIGPAIVNAYYSWNKNKMLFPAGILRYPFYSPMSPSYVNYGRIGAVMGHELTHAYDDEGRQFDANGNLKQWWTNETLSEFKDKAKCFINQYGSIVEPRTGQHLNGENTQGENIADNGGVKLAYKLWCEVSRKESLRMKIIVDAHAPNKYRVNVPLQNNVDFASAYKCPIGSTMNPEKKCAVW